MEEDGAEGPVQRPHTQVHPQIPHEDPQRQDTVECILDPRSAKRPGLGAAIRAEKARKDEDYISSLEEPRCRLLSKMGGE